MLAISRIAPTCIIDIDKLLNPTFTNGLNCDNINFSYTLYMYDINSECWRAWDLVLSKFCSAWSLLWHQRHRTLPSETNSLSQEGTQKASQLERTLYMYLGRDYYFRGITKHNLLLRFLCDILYIMEYSFLLGFSNESLSKLKVSFFTISLALSTSSGWATIEKG